MAITVKNLSKRYQQNLRPVEALRGISLDLPERAVIGVIGPNGAGKTTLFKILTGITRADAGEVSIWGETDLQRITQRIGFLPENPEFFHHISAGELLALALDLAGRTVDAARIDQVLADVGLAGARHARIRTFSKGMIQRIGIAQAIIHDPDLLILDEPMSGLDPLGRRLVGEIIARFSRAGKTVLFSSHDLGDVETLCQVVVLLQHGTIRLHAALAGLQQAGHYQVDLESGGQHRSLTVAGADALWSALQESRDRGERLLRVESGIAKTLEGYFEADR
jgi:ABC-2 type transport system ATP-binding protein